MIFKKMQESILLAWVERLISTEHKDWKSAPRFYLKPLGGVHVFKSTVHPSELQGRHLVKSYFWGRALDVWLINSLNHDGSVLTNGNNLQSPLFNNKFIISGKKPIFFPSCIGKGICSIKDMVDKDTKTIISYDQFENLHGRRGDTLLKYNVLYNSLSRLSFTFNFSTMDDTDASLFHENEVGKIGRKAFYKIIMNDNSRPHVEAIWDRRYGIEMSKTWIWSFEVTKEIKLQILQWKIFHNIYPTAMLLVKMKLKSNANCEYCNVLDTVEHFFFDCLQVKCLWSEVESIIAATFDKRIKLNAKMVILGITSGDIISSTKDLKLINLIVLLGKMCISKMKYGKNYGILPLFEYERRLRQI